MGANQYSGVATKVWIISVAKLSSRPPGRIAANVPSGRATAIANASAVSASVTDTQSDRISSAATGWLLVKENPRSPRNAFDSHAKYCT
ncbi:hypothetical protein D3C86_1655330 [compost metagenome]